MSDEIFAWLSRLGLASLAPVFEANEIDLDAVRDLTEDDLRELGIAMGPRKKLLRALAALQDAAVSDSEVDTDVPSMLPRSAGGEGERRQVTVLFADLCGFTRLSEELDAEEVHALLEAYFKTAGDIVRHYGGMVDKHIGDSVMAVFGAPFAHGNEADRAVRAASSLQAAIPELCRRIGVRIAVHVGVASGQVVASPVGGDDRFTVTGASVNLASRLTDIAKAGEIALSGSVRRALRTEIDVGPARTLQIKGYAEPVEAYILQPSSAPADPGPSRLRRLVGRSREIALFRAVLADCLDSRVGQIVCLRGEAGIGKTRLSEEFMSVARTDGMALHRALVLDFGAGREQDAIRTLVRSLLALPADADEPARAAAVADALQAGRIGTESVMHLHDLLDLPQPPDLRAVHDAMDADRRRRGRSDTILELISTGAAQQPQLIVVEDVHWAEPSVLDHLAAVGRRIADAPVIVVLTTRIEGDPLGRLRRTGLGGTAVTTMDLRALRPDEAAEIAAGYEGTSADWIRLCVQRAEGNPLFLEQLLRNAATAVGSTVPDSVQSLVQARLDALPAADREALQAASVMGQRFSLEPLRRLIDRPDYDPAELVARYLIRPEGEQMLFSHALVRDGVYASLLRTRRRQLHRAAADVFGDDEIALRAQHLDRAEDGAAPAAYADAAQAAARVLDEEAAIAHCDRGLDLDPDAAVAGRLLRLRGDALRNLGRTGESMEMFERAFDTTPTGPDACRALIGLAEGLRVADRSEDALAALQQAEACADVLPALDRARIHYLRGCVQFPLGRTAACLAEHEASLDLARRAGSPEAEASALSGLGDAHYLDGLMRDAFGRFDACVRVCREHDLGRIEVANRHMVGWSRIYLLEQREALEDGWEAAAMAARVGNPRAEQLARNLLAQCSLELGDLDVAEREARRAIEISSAIGAAAFVLSQTTTLAAILWTKGDREQARATIEQALAQLQKTGRRFVGPYVLAVAARLTPDPDRRHALIREAEPILDGGCVSHNQFWFAEWAIDAELEAENWSGAERHAARLEQYARRQPLPFSDFLVARAKNLAACGRGRPEPARLAQLKAQAEDKGLSLYVRRLNDAVAAAV